MNEGIKNIAYKEYTLTRVDLHTVVVSNADLEKARLAAVDAIQIEVERMVAEAMGLNR